MTNPMPVIVGVPRSGTTMLRLMLDSHSDLAIPPETGFLGLPFSNTETVTRKLFFDQITHFPTTAPNWSDFGIDNQEFWQGLSILDPFDLSSGFRCFYQMYADRFQKRRWGDKTPGHLYSMTTIQGRLPEAHFVHLIRDGRDVALSLQPLWFAPTNEIRGLANFWAHGIRQAREQAGRLNHYLEVRYEELVQSPETTLRRICQFLNLPFEAGMVEFHKRAPDRLSEHQSRVANDGTVLVTREQRLTNQSMTFNPANRTRVFDWKNKMSAGQRNEFQTIAGEMLHQLQYETD